LKFGCRCCVLCINADLVPRNGCLDSGLPEPVWRSETGLGVVLTFFTGEVTGEVAGEVIRLLKIMKGAMPRVEMQQALGLKHEEHFRKAYLLPALQAEVLEMTIPDKPKSRLQRYRLTAKGRVVLEGENEEGQDLVMKRGGGP